MKWEMNSGFQVDATLVANRFIDEYMAGASGEYVKDLSLSSPSSEQPDDYRRNGGGSSLYGGGRKAGCGLLAEGRST